MPSDVLIDTHAHLLPRDYPADAPECFPRMEPIDGDTARTLLFGAVNFRARDVFFDAERRIEAQTESGVGMEVVTPMPPLLRYDLPGGEGLSLARHVNEFTATLCAANPERLVGFGLAPMGDPDAATAELTAIRDAGLKGVEIASNVLGTSIGDEKFLPFFQEAERLGLAVFVHAMPAPIDRLPASGIGTYVVGIEGALAVASMILGGTAAKCPDLRISFSHAGGGFAMMVPRAQYFFTGSWNEEPAQPDNAIMYDDGPTPLEYARGFFYDTMAFDRRALRYLVDLLGADRLMYGSDFPAMRREDPAPRTLTSLDLPEDELAAITAGNAWRFLNGA